jgi:hypothetical protein
MYVTICSPESGAIMAAEWPQPGGGSTRKAPMQAEANLIWDERMIACRAPSPLQGRHMLTQRGLPNSRFVEYQIHGDKK